MKPLEFQQCDKYEDNYTAKLYFIQCNIQRMASSYIAIVLTEN